MSLRIITFLLLVQTQISYANDCFNWFLQSGLAAKGKDCELKCSVTPVDMGTFSCTAECSELCSKTVSERILNYVPRLTDGDKIAITKMPYESYKVFKAKQKVDKLTVKIFKNPGRKDESDAFRHFVWSVLLAQDLGTTKAQIFLNAHEEDPTQSKKEKEMDLFNNEQGLTFFKAKADLDLELSQIEKEALTRLKQKKLKVLEPKLDKIPGGYYSK